MRTSGLTLVLAVAAGLVLAGCACCNQSAAKTETKTEVKPAAKAETKPEVKATAPVAAPKAVASASDLKPTRVAVVLQGKDSNPDGMTVDPKTNDIILSIVNIQSKLPGKLMKITPADKLEEYIALPKHPKAAGSFPLGIAFGSDGNLYVADSQGIGGDANYMSRLLKVTVKDGKPVKAEAVVEGFVFSNGVECYGDMVYVNDTKLSPTEPAGNVRSGVYGFKFSELNADKPIVIKRDGKDEHLVCQFITKDKDWAIGANGIAFSPKGVMYVSNCGDASLLAFTLNKEGTKSTSMKTVAERGVMSFTDGIKCCPKTGLVYIADFVSSSVHVVNPKTGKAATIAKGDAASDGKAGQLKKCSEVCIRDGKCYVANINLALDKNVPGDTFVVSVFDLK